jgi:cellulose synthase operon protein C
LKPVLLSTARGCIGAALLLVLAGCGQSDAIALLNKAQQAISERDFASAAVSLKSVLALKPDSAEARYFLGQALLELGDQAPKNSCAVRRS